MRQYPILFGMSSDELKAPIVLARNVQKFSVECWDTNAGDWVDEWDNTNYIPPLVRVDLVLGKNTDNFGKATPTFEASRIISIPAQMAPTIVEVPNGINHCGRRCSLGGGSTPPALPSNSDLPMIISTRKNPRRGFALIIAMLAIFVLATMAATLAFSMKVETKLAFTANDDQRMIWLARSAVEEARCGLVITAKIPGEPYRSSNQWWATGVAGPLETNSELVDFAPNTQGDNDGRVLIPPSQGVATFTMVDLDRYININTAPAPLLQNVFTYLVGANADDISIASDSIQDWVSSGDSPRIAGAKNDYYQSLDPPYNCKEAPMDDPGELKFIRGIQDNDSISNQVVGFHHQLGFGNAMGQGNPITYQELTNIDVFTPFSSGRININTAPLNVLSAIADGDTKCLRRNDHAVSFRGK